MNLFQEYAKNRYESKMLAEDDYPYFKLLANQTFEEYQTKQNEEGLAQTQWELIQALSEDVEHQKINLRQIKGKISGLERSERQLCALLESIKMISTRRTGFDTIKKSLHSLSRHSPYQGTAVQRFPVPDKYVSWDVLFVDYDPIAYSKPKSEYPKAVQEFVDIDLIQILEIGFEKERKDMPVLEWNRSSTSAAGITVNRESWEEVNSEKLIYKLVDGIPVNPYGRTGLKGRGALYRFGPNHYIILIITRYSK